MNIALWVVQGLVAFAMLAAGGMKLATPRAKLVQKQKWVEDFTDTNVKLIGAAEVLGALGLILPGLLGILPILTPIAAVCLLVLMGGAVKTHVGRKEPAAPPAILAALTIFIAVGRSVSW